MLLVRPLEINILGFVSLDFGLYPIFNQSVKLMSEPKVPQDITLNSSQMDLMSFWCLKK